jgi:hypothetical protein
VPPELLPGDEDKVSVKEMDVVLEAVTSQVPLYADAVTPDTTMAEPIGAAVDTAEKFTVAVLAVHVALVIVGDKAVDADTIGYGPVKIMPPTETGDGKLT